MPKTTTDVFTRQKRSEIMSNVKSRNTKPEIKVRSALHRLGYRFRLHRHDLPGTPDIVLPKYRTVIFVHGCFWHRHPGCNRATIPQTNREKWEKKLSRNVERDKAAVEALQSSGWHVFVLWECDIRKEFEQKMVELDEALKQLL